MKHADCERRAQQIIGLRREGLTCKEIAGRLGCSIYHVWYALRSRGEAQPVDPQERLLRQIFGRAEA